jgi:hypothetical protein
MALRNGDARIVEVGRWGSYNAIVRWPDVGPAVSYLVELGDAPTVGTNSESSTMAPGSTPDVK